MVRRGSGLGRAAAAAAVAAVASFALLYLLTDLDIATILFIGLGLASSVGAVVAIDKGESIGQISGFAALLLMLFVFGQYLPRSAVVFALPSSQAVVIDVWTLPLIMLGVVLMFAIVKYVGGDVSRFGLWLISVALTLAYFTYSDVVARTLIAAIQALIVFLPVAQGYEKARLLAAAPVVAGYDKVLVVDLSNVNVYAAYLIPVLTFVALDPFNKVNRAYRSLAALIVLMLVFLQVLGVVLKF
jgi:hypothetical protein